MGVIVAACNPAQPDPATGVRTGGVRTSGEAAIGGPFTLIDHHGNTVSEADFHGKAMLIYFGFTYCPDVCPMSLQLMGAALDQLPDDQAGEFQPILISVDPERDTPDQLASYVSSPSFPEGLIGLTGSPEQVREAANAYRVYYSKAQTDSSVAEYLIDHSSFIYLMDREGRFADIFPDNLAPAQIAERLQHFLEDHPA